MQDKYKDKFQPLHNVKNFGATCSAVSHRADD